MVYFYKNIFIVILLGTNRIIAMKNTIYTFRDHPLRQFNCPYPIIQAPMAGKITTPDFITQVYKEGILPSLATGYYHPDSVKEDLESLKKNKVHNYNLNLFVPQRIEAENPQNYEAYCAIKALYESNHLNQESFEAYKEKSDYQQNQKEYEAILELALSYKTPILSFTFGIPEQSIIKTLKKENRFLLATASSIDELALLNALEFDAIILQGSEAGGHRGGSKNRIGNTLAELLVTANETITKPYYCAGGMTTRSDVDYALAHGAAGVMVGTAFLACEESGAANIHKEAIFSATESSTTLSKAFSGKWARAINNHYLTAYQKNNWPIADYPLQHYFSSPLRALSKTDKNPDYYALWAGSSVHRVTQKTIKELVQSLIKP